MIRPSTAGAKAYDELLAACWGRLHRLRGDVNVMSTTAARHDPAGFMHAAQAQMRGRTLRSHALALAGQGRTAIGEVMRVASEVED